jgi:hypothetical protein
MIAFSGTKKESKIKIIKSSPGRTELIFFSIVESALSGE